VRVAVVYDCLFPWTIGGAERWYRNLAERLAAAGHEVTYLTLRQWDASDPPDLPGVKVVAVGPRMELYAGGKRRILPPLRFGIGLFWHLLRRGRDYDRLHLASFPFFSLLAAGLLRPFSGYRIGVDWHEVWTDDYWRAYLGRLGWLGIAVQRLCARVPQKAYAFSRLHAARAEAIGCSAPVTILTGEYAGSAYPAHPAAVPPTLVYAGRLIPEKRVSLLIDAFALLAAQRPDVRLTIFGRGPEQAAIEAQIARLGLGEEIRRPGFVAEAEIEAAMAEAAAIVQPSEREGYGMVVVEAAARGVPVVVVPAPDNAATELVDAGENGFIAADATRAALAAAMAAAIDGGDALRTRTRAWFAANAERLSIAGSTAQILADMEAG
jgi:glycosyltransferase involved in cell wall biosynthesis